MTDRRLVETSVGFLVLLGLFVAVFSAYASPTRDDARGWLPLTALFTRTDGLAPGAPVRMGGVPIGRVAGLELMPDFRVRARLLLRADLPIPEDSSAAIRSDGLFGGRHVALEPGGSDRMLAAGDSIGQTQGALVIDDLLDRVIDQGRRAKRVKTP